MKRKQCFIPGLSPDFSFWFSFFGPRSDFKRNMFYQFYYQKTVEKAETDQQSIKMIEKAETAINQLNPKSKIQVRGMMK
jgi:hypothetical protein